jgi:hypothetical protein
MAQVRSFEPALVLKEGRKILQASSLPGATVWKRRVRYTWQNDLKRDVLVTLNREMQLRVTDGKTGELLVEGPAV